MSDRSDRLLARREADGDALAAVGLLRSRVRSGRVSQTRVDLAARLGDLAALACAETASRPINWANPDDRATALSAAFSALDLRDVIAMACDWAEAVLPVWEAACPDDARPREAIEAARAWACRPCDASRRAAEAASAAATAAANARADLWAASCAALAAAAAAHAAAENTWAASSASAAAEMAAWALPRGDPRVTARRLAVIAALLAPVEPT